MTIEIPEKPRKHRWVTEAIARGDEVLSVWPSPEELTDKRKQKQFLETIVKVGNDPRVTRVEKAPHDVHSWVFLFHIKSD